MRINKVLPIISLAILLVFTAQKSDKDNDIIKIDLNHVVQKDSIYYSDIFKGFRIVALENSKKCQIGKITSMQVFNGIIYIFDNQYSKSLFLFTQKGKFIRKIGKVGLGDRELRYPIMFSIDKHVNEIYIYDKGGKINIYSASGKYLRQIKKIDPINDFAVQNHHIFMHPVNLKSTNNNPLLINIDSTGRTIKTWFNFSKYGGIFGPSFAIPHLFNENIGIKLIHPFSDTIYSIKSGEVYPYMILSSHNNIPRDTLLLKRKQYDSDFSNRLTSTYLWFLFCPYFWNIHNYLENKKLISLKYSNDRSEYSLLYFKKDKKIMSAQLWNIVDNLTFLDQFTGRPSFCAITEKSLVLAIDDSNRVTKFLKDVSIEKIKLSRAQKGKLKTMSGANYNPIIVFYDVL